MEGGDLSDKLIHFYVMIAIPFMIFIIKFINIIFTNSSESTGDFSYRAKGLLKETLSLLMINIGLVGFSHLLIYSELLPEFGIKINQKPILYTFTLVEVASIMIKRVYDVIENKIKSKFIRISHKVKNIKNKKGIMARFFDFGFKILGLSMIATKIMKKNVEEAVKNIEEEADNTIKEIEEKEKVMLPSINYRRDYDTVRIKLNTKKVSIEDVDIDSCSISAIIKNINNSVRFNEVNDTIIVTPEMIEINNNKDGDTFNDEIKTVDMKDHRREIFDDEIKTI